MSTQYDQYRRQYKFLDTLSGEFDLIDKVNGIHALVLDWF